MKLTVVSILLAVIYLRTGASMYLILAACFAYACLDDALSIHEQLSYYLADSLVSIASFARAELHHRIQPLYFTAVGIVFASLLAIAWRRNEAVHRHTALVFVIMLCVLTFFAAFVVLIIFLLSGYSRVVRRLVGLIEDGGEMLVITLSCTVAIDVFLRVRYHHSRDSRIDQDAP